MGFNIFLTKAKYIIRLDDASHFSNLSKWNKIEEILDKNNILPTVAVIPNNKDQTLKYSEFNAGFWQKVKNWVGKYDWNLKSRPPGGRSLIKHTSKGGQAGFSGDTRP